MDWWGALGMSPRDAQEMMTVCLCVRDKERKSERGRSSYSDLPMSGKDLNSENISGPFSQFEPCCLRNAE